MSKIIYDVIQRVEVENGLPRLVSTNIQVIQGGEDLLSLAISMLTQMGFYEKFEENRTSQYTGYRLKNPRKGKKRYQLVLSQRKEGLYISIPKDIFEPDILLLQDSVFFDFDNEHGYLYNTEIIGRIWVLPSKEDIFLHSMQKLYPSVFKGDTTGIFSFSYYHDGVGELISVRPEHFHLENLADSGSYLILNEDKLFPYAWQVAINSREILEEFIFHFAKLMMEKR